ncbi:MAG: PAS domain S-box protein, partial [Anaerolineae bacterium]
MREGQAFDEQVEAVRQRLEDLIRSFDGRSARQRSEAVMAWEELSAALQDLGAIGEELRRQNEEMAVTCLSLESECQRYHHLFDLAPDGYAVTDGEGTVLEANRAMASLLHMRQGSLVNGQLTGFVAPEERDAFEARVAQLRDGKLDKVPYWMLPMRAHDGVPFWAAVSVAVVPGTLDEPVRLRWLLRDVTQRKWAEEALRESEERYRTIVDSTQDGLTIIEDGRTVYVNDRACEIYGYPREEYVRMTSLDFAAPEEIPRLEQIVKEIRQAGTFPKELECWIIRKDGTRRCIRNRYSYIHQGEASDSRLVVTTDITERKRAAEALRRRAAQLTLLNDVGGKIVAVLDLGSVLDRAARLVQESFGYHHVGLFTLDRGQGELVMRAKAGDFAALYPAGHRLDLGQGMVGWVGQSGKLLLANDVSVEPYYVNLYPDIVPTRSELSVPIRAGEEIVGVLDVQSPELDAFDENDVTVMETLADQIAAAIENARLYEAVQQELAERRRAEAVLERRAAQLALLNDVGGKIAAVLDLGSVLERAARLVREGFGYHHVGLFTLDRDRQELVMRAKAGDFTDLYPPGHRLKMGQGMVGWVGQSCESLLANDVDNEPRYVNLYPDVVPTRSELSVPVCVSTEVVGAIDVQSPELDAFDENDVVVMETLGSQIAVAIENARLYEALRESETRYRAVSELASDFAYAIRVDPDGTLEFDWVTEAFTHITGFTTDEVDERGGWQSVIYPDDLPMVLEHLSVRLSGQRNVAEYRIVTKDGSVRWLRDYGRPELDEALGCVVCIYGAARDITERKHMIRTERLAAMGHIAAALTHEIKGPLQAIGDHLRLALDPSLEPAEREERLRACQKEIDQLTEIAEPVLGLARPFADVRRPVAVDDLVQQALTLLDRPLKRVGIQTVTDFPADLAPVMVVPDQIVQALLNLMINAIEAMPEGGRVQIAAHQDADTAVLTLTNDGPPIPAEHIAYVFDPFFTTKAEDVGLGLYISQNIIEDHDGTIGVENLQDEGVIFTVTLPTAPSAKGQ